MVSVAADGVVSAAWVGGGLSFLGASVALPQVRAGALPGAGFEAVGAKIEKVQITVYNQIQPRF